MINSKRLGVDQPARYEIEVQGRLPETWSEWFSGMALTTETSPEGSVNSVLSGRVADQAALYGLLSRIRDLGLPLLRVQYLA